METPIWTAVWFLPGSRQSSGAGTDKVGFAHDLGLEF